MLINDQPQEFTTFYETHYCQRVIPPSKKYVTKRDKRCNSLSVGFSDPDRTVGLEMQHRKKKMNRGGSGGRTFQRCCLI